ncbi:MAG: glycoside hydrolase family 2 protein [Pedobacter sp.]|nr:MAG: glycoside hydrolase family 2 protein [Pedobacter sp.]
MNKQWKFKEADKNTWLPAKVPGEVHLDLIQNKIIPDPFFRNNEQEVAWVSQKNWDYQTEFDLDPNFHTTNQCELVFEGLDTYAEVFLNGKSVLVADNMFRIWKIKLSKADLKLKGNQLLVKFTAALPKVEALAKKDAPFLIPDHPRAYARKAPYQFGWDWGPKLTGVGIWKKVYLQAFQASPEESTYKVPVNSKLIQERDKDGVSFYFEIEGKPVYMKGANYIPLDPFPSRPTRADYKLLLERVKEANMNMLRVWGGGIYEQDDFYELCDSLGIYVWQDFMFAGAMVPGDAHFFQNVKAEIYDQVKRLRNYKSIVIWCGNNEVDEAWNRWGWQKEFQINTSDSLKLWHDYTRLFRDSIPHWLKELDPQRPYISTSPKLGWGVPESITEADSHYWGVWWGDMDFEVFEEKTGRFVSEYGMQGMPGMNSILNFTTPEDRYLFSPVMKNHQKANNGYQKLNGYIHRYVLDTTQLNRLSIEDYSYAAQVVQYYGFKNMILIHRQKEPYNMGTLLWQMNDCWPVASWSITDYDHREPRAAWYAVKNTYADKMPERDYIRPKDWILKDPQLSYKIEADQILIRAESDAKYVQVTLADYYDTFSDNFFDLKAGEVKIIKYKKSELKSSPKVLKLKSLYDLKRKLVP